MRGRSLSFYHHEFQFTSWASWILYDYRQLSFLVRYHESASPEGRGRGFEIKSLLCDRNSAIACLTAGWVTFMPVDVHQLDRRWYRAWGQTWKGSTEQNTRGNYGKCNRGLNSTKWYRISAVETLSSWTQAAVSVLNGCLWVDANACRNN